LCGKWSEAIELILKPREGDRDEMSRARATWWSTRDAEKALRELRGHQCMERKLLEGLVKYDKKNLVSALSSIPFNMRLMYIHAYQSYIWNCVLSRRMKRFGAHPVVGDLAMCDPVVEECLEEPEVEEQAAEASVASKTTTKPPKPAPVEVTEDNLSKFKLTDIVLPLPGYDVRYPQNDVKSWYDEFLKKDGMENFNFKSKVRDYSLPGGYRKIAVQPEHVSWELMCYNDFQVSLVHGDMELLKKEELLPQVTDGKFKAIKLELSLPSSSYATMALREVLKSGTSAAYHTTLNVT
jgi:tRNA pseudouridine13 synthase